MPTTNFSRGGTQTETFQELHCSPSLVGGLQQEFKISLLIIYILLSITAFLGNFLILVALHKESSLHPPSKLFYCCLATTDLLIGVVAQPLQGVYWISLGHEQWNLCRYAFDSAFITAHALDGVALMTMTAISVDRLLALLLGLRYRQIVTLKRTYIIVTTFWIASSVIALCYTSDYRIISWYGHIIIPSCLVISVASYVKIFRGLSHHHAQVQDHVQQQPSQRNALNMARYKKALYSALWVQLALVVCAAPFFIVTIVITNSKTYSLQLIEIWDVAVVLVHFNSTLNPFLYCWKIIEVRQAVKQTIRRTLCRPGS
ncbi:melanocyte-stimulating hormone receptor-like [Stylophora pistillata]|uniref:melanocyte-stimulating hormone receptor-like n=1 Tax=Stylophora pistillata TaxID=50429 RepID=UPI000C052108|nr:melanocyte-stimulating hormone receptor-like [Stylophora pistillata]